MAADRQASGAVGARPSRRETVLGGAAALLVGATASPRRALAAAPAPRRSFRPGEPWLDTAGAPIQAHGGSIIKVGDLFYWYGENKERTTGADRTWHWGVRAYSSRDLYNWDSAGIIIPPQPDDPASPLFPQKGMDRPHIFRDAATRKFVCWIKVMDAGRQTRAVLTADAVTGPYTLVRKNILPLGMNAGDFDLAVAPEDGKAYMYFERVHTEMICADLTPDGTDFTGYYSTHLPRPAPPAVREGPAHFTRQGRHYLATSGTTGYFPNPSEIAVADGFHGPFETLGDLHPADRTRTSFNSQICSVFRHPGKRDLYIALADRWMPELGGPAFESGETSRLLRSAITKATSTPRQPLTPAEGATMRYVTGRTNTSLSRYVWLPIRFAPDGRPTIEWRAEWSLDEFADA